MRFTRTLISNLTTLVIAIILAIAIWATAVRASDPVETLTFEIPVEVVGKAADAEVINRPPQSVLITIEGPSSALAQALPSTFEGFIDLTNVPYGESEVPIQVQGEIEQVDIVSIFPESAQIRQDQIVSRNIPVALQVRGEVPRGHRLGTTRLEPATVQVTGSADRVDDLAEGRVIVFVDDAREDISEMRRPTFYDFEGNVASTAGLTISPQEVETIVPVIELAGYAEKPISALWVGEPTPGYRLLDVRVEPASIQVTGSPDQLDTLFVQTEPIDITGLTETVTQQVALDLPEGVTPVDLQPVFVTVEIVPIRTSSVVQRSVEVRALEDGLQATVEPPEVRVFMFGPLPVLESLADEDVRVTVDVLGLVTGTHVLEPLVTVSASEVEVRSTQPAQVTVVITGVISQSETLTPSETLLIDPPAQGLTMAGASESGQDGPYPGQDMVADIPWLPFGTAPGRKGGVS
ncbi:MAG: YbbR-like domain-containing protein [Candidatus Promineifilaceae bacterium]|jgi:YbbR domain-containing protein